MRKHPTRDDLTENSFVFPADGKIQKEMNFQAFLCNICFQRFSWIIFILFQTFTATKCDFFLKIFAKLLPLLFWKASSTFTEKQNLSRIILFSLYVKVNTFFVPGFNKHLQNKNNCFLPKMPIICKQIGQRSLTVIDFNNFFFAKSVYNVLTSPSEIRAIKFVS